VSQSDANARQPGEIVHAAAPEFRGCRVL
jgi:hypothetical protein